MYKRLPILALLLVTALAAVLGSTMVVAQDDTSQSEMSSGSAEDIAAITAIITERYPEFANSHDAAGYASMYSEDALWIPPSAPERVGREGIATAMQASFDKNVFDVQPHADEVEVIGDFAYVIGTADGVLTPRDGSDPKPIQFRVFWLFQRGDDGWQIVRQIWNNAPAPAEARKASETPSLLAETEYMK